MSDMAQNHCNLGAEAYFQLNAELDTELNYTPELLEWFLKMGAEVDEDRVYFKSLDVFRK
jgi:hypothetical protein